MNEEEILYSIALRKCRNIGDNYFFQLMNHFSSAKEVWTTHHKDIHEKTGIGLKSIEDIGNTKHLDFAEKEIIFCQKNQVNIILRHREQLPGWLGECNDAPAILYHKGNLPKKANYLSIVGTRNMTIYGKHFIHEMMEMLRETLYLHTVSGLALGVDTEVHQRSIHQGITTIAVLAHGFHTLYPSKNKKLAEEILEKGGCLLSEFNSNQKPDRENFIQRNRIVAGISPATIVVETAFGGGSISTANFANGYNRDVFALPGKINDKYSQGCNKLIGESKAKALFSISDMMEDLGYIHKQKNIIGDLFASQELPEMNAVQEKIYSVIRSKNGISSDDLALLVDMNTKDLMVELLQMELSGLIRCNSSRQYLVS